MSPKPQWAPSEPKYHLTDGASYKPVGGLLLSAPQELAPGDTSPSIPEARERPRKLAETPLLHNDESLTRCPGATNRTAL